MISFWGLLIIAALGFFILWSEGLLEKRGAMYLAAGLLILAMVLRGACMEHETLDYQNFLTKWVQYYRDNGGFRGLGKQVGNYNVPYLYFLAAFSYFKVRDLYLIKLLSVLFDLILAWGALRLAGLYRSNVTARLAAFFVTLFLPTVVLNGAYWGQCDVIYVGFALWSVYFALDGKPVRAVIFIGISFAFKLQAVFVLPVFLIFLFVKKLRWPHLLLFPVTYVVMMLPAVLAGRSMKDLLLFYIKDAGSVGGGLNYNSPSVFAFVRGGDLNTELLSKLGIGAAALFLLLLFVFCWLERERLNDRRLLLCTVLISVAVPFFLPHMHDRYFFAADVLSLALVFAYPKLLPLPFLVSFASLLGYHAYLKQRYLLPMSYGAAALLLAMVLTIFALSLPERGSHLRKN